MSTTIELNVVLSSSICHGLSFQHGPMELEEDNLSDAFTGYLYLSVTSAVQAWVPWEGNLELIDI